ncbi:MAG TPA: GNAT family protein [Chloroflexota bacterium]|nr:GNAT family protein [Chloroflexota bacterium]
MQPSRRDETDRSIRHGDALPFALVERAGNRAIGSTRYHYIELQHRRLEIGVTWITPRFQRTAINTEAKYLLLGHAFDTLGCQRVEFKADANNARSCQALPRIGAVQEGVFRKHMRYPDGRIRHSVYFSIIDEDWPSVKRGLEEKLTRHDEHAGARHDRAQGTRP